MGLLEKKRVLGKKEKHTHMLFTIGELLLPKTGTAPPGWLVCPLWLLILVSSVKMVLRSDTQATN